MKRIFRILSIFIVLIPTRLLCQSHYEVTPAEISTSKYDEFCPAILEDQLVFCSNLEHELLITYQNRKNMGDENHVFLVNDGMLLRRSTRARRFSLQVSEARRGAVLTMPAYSSFADADEFLSRHLDWLKERVADLPEPVPFIDGAIIPLRGLAHVLLAKNEVAAARQVLDRAVD